MKSEQLHGLIPATVLPMKNDASIDEAAFREYLQWIVDQGVVGVAVNADTGEGPHLSHQEKVRVVEIARDILPSNVALVAGLAGPYQEAAVAAAKDYTAAGAQTLLVFPIPAYLSKPLDPEIPYRYHSAIAEVGTPMILFQLQESLAGVKYERATFEQLLAIDGVVAVKEATFDARHFLSVVRAVESADRPIAMLTGNDNFIYESLVLGAKGGLLGFGAIMTSQQVQLIDLANEGQFARAEALGERIQALADVVFDRPVAQYRARLKEALVMIGVLKEATVRPPLLPLSETDKGALRQALQEADLL